MNVLDGDSVNFSISEYHPINEEEDLVDAQVDVSTREIGYIFHIFIIICRCSLKF